MSRPVRSYTKYMVLRRRKKQAHWPFWLLSGAGLLFLAWLWWGRPAPPAQLWMLAKTQFSRWRPSPRAPTPAEPKAASSTNAARLAALPEFRPKPLPARAGGGSEVAGALPGLQTNARPSTPAPNILPATRHPINVFEAQLALDRLGFSSGPIDGMLGSQTRAAFRAFQLREKLPLTGEFDLATKLRLACDAPALTLFVVSSNDLARLRPVGRTWLEKSQQTRLDYESILEMAVERGHANPNLLRLLNPGVTWSNIASGTAIRIPNTKFPVPTAKAAFLRIQLDEKILQAFDAATNLLAHFPCSIARRIDKRPIGQFTIEKIAVEPNYRFDPALFPESDEGRLIGHHLTIPPGPNNPVGTVWIGLNKSGYGIHGTPHPERVGRTESHGCFRLANWNAEYLASLVSVGTPVWVEL